MCVTCEKKWPYVPIGKSMVFIRPNGEAAILGTKRKRVYGEAERNARKCHLAARPLTAREQKKLNLANRARMSQHLVESGKWSIEQIAAAYGCDESTIYRDVVRAEQLLAAQKHRQGRCDAPTIIGKRKPAADDFLIDNE